MIPFFSILLISQILCIYGFLAEENKFIDQLPEPDKKEFIERVVRRIAGDINVKNTNLEESKNVSDAELDKHSDYVKNVINEEKQKFVSNDNVKVTQQTPRILNPSHIDLTLVNKKRNKRNENSEPKDLTLTTADDTVVTIPVKTVYDVDPNKELNPVKDTFSAGKDDIQVKNLRIKARRSTSDSNDTKMNAEKLVLSDKSKENNEVTNLTTEKINDVKSTANYSAVSTITTTESDKNSVRDHDSQTYNTTVDDAELSDQNKISKRHNKSSSEDNSKGDASIVSSLIVSKNEDGDRNITLDTTSEDTTKLDKAIEHQVSLENDPENKDPPKLEVKPIQNENLDENLKRQNKKEVIEFTSLKPDETVKLNYAMKTVNSQVDLTHSNIHNSSGKDKDIQSKDKSSKKEKETLMKDKPVASKNIDESNTSTTINQSIGKLEKIINDKPTALSEEINTLQVAQEVVKALRIGIERDTNKYRLQNKNDLNNVKVYGINDNSNENSQERQENNREQPHYVPVYNYYANNAYYNAYNKYGRNQEDSKNSGEKHDDSDEDYADTHLLSENSNRAFYKRPRTEHNRSRSQSRVKNAQFKNNIYLVLPTVAKKPYQLSFHDYDNAFGNNFLRKTVLRTKGELNDSNENLKARLKHVREKMYTYKEVNKDRNFISDKKNGRQELKNIAWLDKNVKFYTTKVPNLAKSKQKLSHAIDYDYMGDTFNFDYSKKRSENIELSDIIKSGLKLRIPKNSLNPRVHRYREIPTRVKKTRGDSDFAKKVRDIYPLLSKLVKIVEYEKDEVVEACIRVIGDMIQTNNEGLDQYDWLESTVNIQSAIEKLSDLVTAVASRQSVHPSDLELLKYTTYLHSLAAIDKNKPTSRNSLPKSTNKKKAGLKNKVLGSRVWLYRVPDPDTDNDYKYDYNGLQTFLDDLADNLYDLHNAFKYISMVTTLKNQNWFRNLKELYLHKPSRKQLLELVLHLGITRLFNLIEDSSKNGLENNLKDFISRNEMEISGIKEAFGFVLKVLAAAKDNRLLENYETKVAKMKLDNFIR